LDVSKDKRERFSLASSNFSNSSEVLSERLSIVPFYELNLILFTFHDKRSEARQTLFATTTNTDQQSVATRLSDDSADPENLLNGFIEENQFQLIIV
jgi:hypothetical protein